MGATVPEIKLILFSWNNHVAPPFFMKKPEQTKEINRVYIPTPTLPPFPAWASWNPLPLAWRENRILLAFFYRVSADSTQTT